MLPPKPLQTFLVHAGDDTGFGGKFHCFIMPPFGQREFSASLWIPKGGSLDLLFGNCGKDQGNLARCLLDWMKSAF